MADKSSSGPIPEGWRFEKKDGSKVSSYFCPTTGQRFFTYDDMMQYVNYAKKAGLPKYMPNFDRRKRSRNGDRRSKPADDKIAENLDSEKCIDKEKSLDLEKGTDLEKSLDSKKGTDLEKSLDSKEITDTEGLDSKNIAAGENLKARNDSSENRSAPAADIMTDVEKCSDSKEGTRIEKSLDSKEITDTKGLDSNDIDAGENLKSQNDHSENRSAPAADIMILDDPILLQQKLNVPHVASAAGTQSLIIEETPNVPPVVRSPPGIEDSSLAANRPTMIQGFAAGNPESRSGPEASKLIRCFRRRGR